MKPSTLIFDLDNTLAESKSPVSTAMANLLCSLLSQNFTIAIITGGAFSQINSQAISQLPCSDFFKQLFALPTSGSALYTFTGNDWECAYSEQLSSEEKTAITRAFDGIEKKLGFSLPETLYGPRLEDRGSQMSFSAFGQNAPNQIKTGWDSDGAKRQEMKKILLQSLSGFHIGIGGESTLDITREGIDKGYGLERFFNHTGITPRETIFFGDALFEGGNDYPVLQTGVATEAVKNPTETAAILKGYLAKS